MIVHLAGLVAERGIDYVVVDVGGIGYRATVSLHTLADLPEVGKPTRILTHLHVREDNWTLFGFSTPEERRAFEICFAVQGVGPKLVISILSSLHLPDLEAAVARGDVARLRKIPGVGQKTAERLVLELRDKLPGKMALAAGAGTKIHLGAPLGDRAAHAASALVNLGYKAAEAERAAFTAHEADPAANVETLVKQALRVLMGA